jgi:hypothetical protein
MNRFNLDTVFTLNVRRVDKGYISNLITLEVDNKIEKQIQNMSSYNDAASVLNKFMLKKT